MRKTIIIVLLLCSGIVDAYDPKTHREIAYHAFQRSYLGANWSNTTNIFGFGEKFPNSYGVPSNALELIRDGVEFEDKIMPILNDRESLRMKYHFYDPQNDGRPLTLKIPATLTTPEIKLVAPYASPDWITEKIGGNDIEEQGQNFSFSDANNYLYRALTSKTKEDRDINWGLTYQTLGHVIHHIQDMAQPQHTRNDSHLPWEDSEIQFYEIYTEEKRIDPNRGLPFTGYPDIDLNVFNTARSFWGSVDISERKGLAWFSSTNFVSAGTNFQGGLDNNSNLVFDNDPEYPLPSGADANSVDSSIDIEGEECNNQNECVPTIINGSVTFIETPVYDANLNQNSINEGASTFSIFDYDLIGQSLPPKFALNSLNYDAAHEYLIPRAVAYSAGLIDYFFRGRIDANVTTDGDGIEITNVSKGNFAFQAGGAFEVYYVTDADEHKQILSLINLALGSSLPVDGVHTITGLTAALDGISDLGAEGKIIVLFDGDIGSERGVAVTSINMAKGLTPRLQATYVGKYEKTFNTYPGSLVSGIKIE